MMYSDLTKKEVNKINQFQLNNLVKRIDKIFKSNKKVYIKYLDKDYFTRVISLKEVLENE